MLKRKDAIIKTDKTLRLMRCFEECVYSLVDGSKRLPQPVAFQRSKVYLKLEAGSSNITANLVNVNLNATSTSESNIYLFDQPVEDSQAYIETLNNFEYLNSDSVHDRTSIEYLVSNSVIRVNSLGVWILIAKIKVNFTLFKRKKYPFLVV
jgi:hypothetical protein